VRTSATDVRWNVHSTQSKSRHFPGVANDIIPPISPQKAGETVQLLQSQLPSFPNPPIIAPHPADTNTPIFYSSSLALLKSCYQTLTGKTEKRVFWRMTRAWMPASYGDREVVLC